MSLGKDHPDLPPRPAHWPEDTWVDTGRRMSWLPLHWGQGQKTTSGGKVMKCFIAPDGKRYFHKPAVEKHEGRTLDDQPHEVQETDGIGRPFTAPKRPKGHPVRPEWLPSDWQMGIAMFPNGGLTSVYVRPQRAGFFWHARDALKFLEEGGTGKMTGGLVETRPELVAYLDSGIIPGEENGTPSSASSAPAPAASTRKSAKEERPSSPSSTSNGLEPKETTKRKRADEEAKEATSKTAKKEVKDEPKALVQVKEEKEEEEEDEKLKKVTAPLDGKKETPVKKEEEEEEKKLELNDETEVKKEPVAKAEKEEKKPGLVDVKKEKRKRESKPESKPEEKIEPTEGVCNGIEYVGRLWTYQMVRATVLSPPSADDLELAADLPEGVTLSKRPWVYWLPEGWRQCWRLTSTGTDMKYYLGPDGKGFWHKKDIEAYLGQSLPDVPPPRGAKEMDPADRVPLWPEWLPTNWKTALRVVAASTTGETRWCFFPPEEATAIAGVGACYWYRTAAVKGLEAMEQAGFPTPMPTEGEVEEDGQEGESKKEKKKKKKEKKEKKRERSESLSVSEGEEVPEPPELPQVDMGPLPTEEEAVAEEVWPLLQQSDFTEAKLLIVKSSSSSDSASPAVPRICGVYLQLKDTRRDKRAMFTKLAKVLSEPPELGSDGVYLYWSKHLQSWKFDLAHMEKRHGLAYCKERDWPELSGEWEVLTETGMAQEHLSLSLLSFPENVDSSLDNGVGGDFLDSAMGSPEEQVDEVDVSNDVTGLFAE